jgi:hypothetical protein
VLVKALGTLPAADRDLAYAWLLRQGFAVREEGVVTVRGPARNVPLTTLLQQSVTVGSGSAGPLAQASGQQVVPVRFSSEQHAQLRQWCSEHGFSMATVIRGLVARFLEGQLPGPAEPA